MVPPGYKQTEVGVIPVEWEVKPLNELASLYITLVMLGFPTLILANGLLDKLKKPSSAESAPEDF